MNGTITISNTSGTAALTVTDSADATGRAVTIGAASLTGTMVNGATVNYTGLASLTVDGGTATNTFTVNNTPSAITTTLNSGTGNDTTNVLATGTTSTLDINGQSGTDSVDLGSTSHTAQNLNGTIGVANASGLTALTVDDSADTTGRTVSIGATSLTGSLVNGTTVNYANLSGLTVDGGSGGNIFDVSGTTSAIPTTFNTGSGDDTTDVTATCRDDQLA